MQIQNQEELIDQIFSMMEYLGEKNRYISKPGVIMGPGFVLDDRKIIDEDKLSFWDIECLHRQLIRECHEKALQTVLNIELANNNLFWCCEEDE